MRLLQQRMPSARVVYASATAATDPQHVGYCSRLGLWKAEADDEIADNQDEENFLKGDEPFDTFIDFLKTIRGSGRKLNNSTALMESVAMYLRSKGAVVSRALAFDGCTFELVDGVMEASSEMCFNNAADLWAQLHRTIEILHRNGELRCDFKGVGDNEDDEDDDDGHYLC